MVHHVTTKKRTYNSVQNKRTWKRTRKLWKDFTPVEEVFRWYKTKQKWIKVSKEGW